MRWFCSAALAFVASSLLPLVACDSGEEPKPVSVFPDEAPNQRQLVGHVRAGTEPVAGALVRVDPTPGFTVDEPLVAAGSSDPRFAPTTTTDAAGGFRFQFAPSAYDLSLTHDRDLYVFHELLTRAFDPPFAVEAPVTGFRARVLPTTSPPPRGGNATAFFVSGDEARTIAPATGSSGAFDATFRHFDSTITLHAVEYIAALGPAAAVSEGKLDVRVRDGIVVTPVVAMTMVSTKGAATFEATPPPGYVLAPLELEMDFGLRTSVVTLPLPRIAPGDVLNLAVATDARYFVRARAMKGGAVSDSGRYRVNPFDKNPLVLPPPISSEAPIDDQAIPMGEGTTTAPATLSLGGPLAARLTAGVVEHALIPESGTGTIIHVATGERTTMLPDAGALGLPPPAGRYLWTIQSFPTVLFTDHLTGEDGRVMPPSWTSAPMLIVVK